MMHAVIAGRIRYGTRGMGMPQSRGVVVALCAALLFASLSLAPRLPRSVPDTAPAPITDPAKARVSESYGKLPLSFEENYGQTDPSVRYLAHGGGYTLFLTPTEITLSLTPGTPHPDALRDPRAPLSSPTTDAPPAPATTLRFSFPGANPDPLITAEDALPGTINYFVGNDPAQWRSNIDTAAKVRYHDLYPGIDLLLYGTQGGKWEYDVIVAPGADPAQFALAVDGIESKEISVEGDLVMRTRDGYIRQHAPVSYQNIGGQRRSVVGKYDLYHDGTVRFRVSAYDHDASLTIDPTTLVYSTFLGGPNRDYATGVAIDGIGSTYVAGLAAPGFPTSAGAFQGANRSQNAAFVTKLNTGGTAAIYSTYILGTNGFSGTEATAIAVDAGGNAHITGFTDASDFPITAGAFQTVFGGGDSNGGPREAFITKLNASGTGLLYSTFLGGSANDVAAGIAIDGGGNAYVTGYTVYDYRPAATANSFPTTSGAYKPRCEDNGDIFISKLSANGTTLVYSSCLDNPHGDGDIYYVQAITVDHAGAAYITGSTSDNIPTTPGAVQPTYDGGYGASGFATKLNTTGSALVYSTFINGTYAGHAIAVDVAGNAYITGGGARSGFTTTPGAYQRTVGVNNTTGFVTKINASGTAFVYSTFIGGSSGVIGGGIAIDTVQNVYVSGSVESESFPTTPDTYQAAYAGGGDAFVLKLNATGTALLYATYLGGSGSEDQAYPRLAIDNQGAVYIAGRTSGSYNGGPSFPTTQGSVQPTFGGVDDGFVAKLSIGASSPNPVPSNPVVPVPARPPQTKTVGSVIIYASSFTPTGTGWSASGTVWIGDYTIVEDATVTLSNGALSGNGLVSFMTTSNGSQRTTLFQDSFAVSAGGILTPQSASGSQRKIANIAGFLINPGAYQLTVDVVNGKVNGNPSLQLVIPGYVVAGAVQFTLTHAGAAYGSLTAPISLPIGPLSLYVTKAILGSDGLTIIDATWQLPDELGGLKASLDVRQARITGDGQFILSSGSASVTLPNMRFGGDNGFKMEGVSATLSYDFGRYTFHGQGKFHIPGLKTFPGGCDELGPSFTLTAPPLGVSQISLSVGGCKFKIADVFGVPIYVTGVHGNFDLTSGQVVIEVGISLQVADDLPPLGAILTGDFDAHWDSSWSVSLTGTAHLFTWPLASASLTLDARNGLVGTFHSVNYGSWQTLDGRIHLWGDASHFHFTGTGTVTLGIPKGSVDQDCSGLLCFPFPPFDVTGPSLNAQFGEFRTPSAASTYGFKGIVNVLGLKPAFFVGTDGHARYDLFGLQHFQLIDQTNGTNSVRRNTAGSASATVTVGTTPTAVIGIAYDTGSPTLTLTDPNGRTITATTSDPQVTYTSVAGELLYTIAAPPAGNWTVTVGNLTGGEHYLVDVLGAPLAAAITQIPSLAPKTNRYTITTQATGASGATYSLYYDTDASGNDGKPIVTGIPITQTQATWDTRTVPNGSYYVYALLDDMANAPVVAYSASPVTISDTTPPAIPTNLHATATGGDAAVMWQPSPDVDVAGYHIAYQQPGAGQTFSDDVPDGQANSATIHGLNINGSWQVWISAYDINGNESARSTSVAVPISVVKTFVLTATTGGTAAANPPATTYAPGTAVTLTATASTGYTFTGWTVDGADGGKTNPLPLTATSSDAVVANFAPLPAITGISPPSGSVNGGGIVTITGAGFIAPATVTFDGLAATTTAISADLTQITVTPPAHGAGLVGIAVTTPLGSVPLANAYTYGNVGPLPPAQPSVAPGGPPSPLPPVRPAPVGAPPSPPQPIPNPRP